MPARPLPLRLAFAGTPEFAVPHLVACKNPDVEIVAVYTQPDRPAGRGRQLASSPVKRAALAAGLRVEQPQTLKDPLVQQCLRKMNLDLLIVVAYGLILPRKVLMLPRLGCWNMHASLLPRWRGAAPIQRALLAGDAETGVCLMQMEAGLDTGPVLLRRKLAIASVDTGGSLHDRLAVLGADVLGEGLQRVLRGETMTAQPQASDGVTYAHKLDKAEARLDWNESAVALERKVRAFDPWPVAEAQIDGERLRIWAAHALPMQANAAPGSVVAAHSDGIDVACADGLLRIIEVQRDGGKRIAVREYLNARAERGKARL
jgi:methionyl-tRNA formyltransferase